MMFSGSNSILKRRIMIALFDPDIARNVGTCDSPIEKCAIASLPIEFLEAVFLHPFRASRLISPISLAMSARPTDTRIWI